MELVFCELIHPVWGEDGVKKFVGGIVFVARCKFHVIREQENNPPPPVPQENILGRDGFLPPQLFYLEGY